MKIKSYYAETMDQALQSASKELGDEALILNTRETPAEFRHFGRYEVVCACANPPKAEPLLVQPPTPDPTPPVPPSPQAEHKPRRVVVLTGPAGAGKSTCCAKIAISAKCAGTSSPALLTWDSGRVGGSDLLRAFADIAGIPIRELDNAEDFSTALKDLRGHDLLIIDTPAADADTDALSKIAMAHRSVVAGGDRLETHLVLSAAYSESYLRKCLDLYAAFDPAFLLPTHLDESNLELAGPGLERLGRLRIEWCSTGRAVPEDLQATAQVLAKAAAIDTRPTPQPVPSAVVLPTPPLAVPTNPADTIEQILTRFRRDEIPSSTHLIRATTRNAA